MAQRKRERILADESKVDRISVLPNEVLGFILSLLTFKQATATSILSRSWHHLWTLTPTLDFDSFEKSKNLEKKSLLKKERSDFITRVDRTLASADQFLKQSGPNLDEFRVVFDLTESHRKSIDGWLRYAVSRNVERLELLLPELHVSNNGGGSRFLDKYQECYEFPYNEGNFPSNLKALKKLCLHLVSIDGEAVEFFLGNCPRLEHLSVSGSQLITSLEVVGTFPAFKCLEISSCHKLESVFVYDSSIERLKYGGQRVRFVFMDVPMLSELWINLVGHTLKTAMDMFSSLLKKLKMLKLYSTYWLSWKESADYVSNFEMPKLEELVVSIGEGYCDTYSLSPIINLISASPHLQRFVLEATHEYNRDLDYSFSGEEEVPTDRSRAYRHLKEVELVGYRNTKKQFEFIMHFVEDEGIALENIIVDPRCFKLCTHRPWDRISLPEIEDETRARVHAKEQFREQVCSKINVKIL